MAVVENACHGKEKEMGHAFLRQFLGIGVGRNFHTPPVEVFLTTVRNI